MANVKTAISIEEPLFERAEALAREMRISRSRLFVLALEDYIRRRENQRLLKEINEAYGDTPDEVEQSLRRRMRRTQRQIVEGEQ